MYKIKLKVKDRDESIYVKSVKTQPMLEKVFNGGLNVKLTENPDEASIFNDDLMLLIIKENFIDYNEILVIKELIQ